MQSRDKLVLISIRGFGKCPNEQGPHRFEEQTCNDHDSVGDEICIAKQIYISGRQAGDTLSAPTCKRRLVPLPLQAIVGRSDVTPRLSAPL